MQDYPLKAACPYSSELRRDSRPLLHPEKKKNLFLLREMFFPCQKAQRIFLVKDREREEKESFAFNELFYSDVDVLAFLSMERWTRSMEGKKKVGRFFTRVFFFFFFCTELYT